MILEEPLVAGTPFILYKLFTPFFFFELRMIGRTENPTASGQPKERAILLGFGNESKTKEALFLIKKEVNSPNRKQTHWQNFLCKSSFK